MSAEARIRIVAVFASLALALGLALGTRAALAGDDGIRIDDAPAFACLGEGCP